MKNLFIPAHPDDASVYLEAIIRNAIDCIITINENGIVESLNPATEKLFGYAASEIIGHNISKLMPSPYQEQHDTYIENYKKTGQAKIVGIGREVPGLSKQGEIIPLRLAVSEAWIKDKRIFIGTIHDLREVKEAEAKIRRLNEDLEHKVNVRTEELAAVVNRLLDSNNQLVHEINERMVVEKALRKSETELKKALEKEKELSELKSRFVTMASHEFRTPLSAILSSADLIEAYTKDSPGDKRLKHTNRIKSSVNSLINILNDFLSLSKLEENMVNIERVKVGLKDFCFQVNDELKDLLKPGQQIRHPDGIPDETIYLDKKILKGILYNLLSNAIKYSENGLPIDCFLTVDNLQLEVKIVDYGIGIPEEDQQHLFQRFFRAKNSENIQGTGLGLHIVKRYLDILNGSIDYYSKVGKGTTFTVKIPLPNPVEP